MKRLFLIAAMGMAAVPASADNWHPITGTETPKHYDVATGKITEMTDARTRGLGRPLWSLTDRTGFGSVSPSWLWLDCADMENDVMFRDISFAYYTNCLISAGDIELWITIYTDENNYEEDPRKLQSIIEVNVPGSQYPLDEYWGAVWFVTLPDPIEMRGADLDGDALQDFGYGFVFVYHPPGIAGPASAGEPNVEYPLAPGADDGWCFWDKINDPNFGLDPNLHDPNRSEYIGYFDFYDPNLLGQFYFEVFAGHYCPSEGASGRFCTADVYGDDCVVDLSDLAHLLSNYGMTAGASVSDGDLDPYHEFFPGDGDVDMGDLAEMLAQYGDDCGAP